MFRPLLTSCMLIATTAIALMTAPSALAGTSETIHEDALDGRIDGTYTLAQIRAADSTVPTQQREYTLWDDIVADYMRRLRNPDAPDLPIVQPRDFNKDGKIGADDVAEARKRTAVARKAVIAKDTGNTPTAETRDPDNIAPVDKDDTGGDDSDDDSDGSSLWLLLALIGIPLIVLGIGLWRMQRTRKRGGDTDPSAGDDDGFTSSFSSEE